MVAVELADDIPGSELVRDGLRDLSEGRVTPAACLASIARPWLARAGLLRSTDKLTFINEPESTLYRLLGDEPGDPYGRYNALLRRVVSFERELMRRHQDNAKRPALSDSRMD